MQANLAYLTEIIPNPLGLAALVLVVGFLITRLAFQNSPVGKFLCQLASFAGFTALLAVARVSPLRPTPAMDLTMAYLVVSVLKIVWWLAASWLLAGFMRAALVFKRKPMETRFLQDLLAGLCYVAALLGIVSYVFDTPVSGLLAASGVIAIVLGLALQSTLGDVFSGIVLNLAKPYHPGDWIILEGGLQGRVIDTTWRATQILTLDKDLAVVPNSIIAKGRIINASGPSASHGLSVTVRLDPQVSPSSALAVLENAVLSCNRILRVPAADIVVHGLDATALECHIQFFVPFIENANAAQNEVFDMVFRHCLASGIRMAPSANSGAMLPAREAPMEPADVPLRLLQRLSIFASLSNEERLSLAPRMVRRAYKPGDVVVEQGVVATSLLVVISGVLVGLQKHAAEEMEVLRFAPGDCLCQASVLTGAVTTFKVVALTRAAVFEIHKDDLAPILKARPALAAELGQIMARREAAGKTRLGEFDDVEKNAGNLAERIAARVKLLFGLS